MSITLNNDHLRKIRAFELPQEGWEAGPDKQIELILEMDDYTDRWRISEDGVMVLQERLTEDGEWILMCPDCGNPFDSEEHRNFGGF